MRAKRTYILFCSYFFIFLTLNFLST